MQKYIKILSLGLLLVGTIVFLSACTRNIHTVSSNSDPRFQCQDDTDCVSEETACNNCGCPRAVNRNYKQDIDCTKLDPNDPVAKYGCNVGCPLVKPICSHQTCIMK